MFRTKNQVRRRERALTLLQTEQTHLALGLAHISIFNIFKIWNHLGDVPVLAASQTDFKQVDCPLFALPFELRQMIWRDVIGNGMIHIMQLNDGLAHVRCTHSQEGKWNTAHHHCWVQGMVRIGLTIAPESPTPPQYFRATYPSLIAFMKTCRLIYSESIDYLYKENTFDFRHLEEVSTFTTGVLPRRLDAIKSMQISCTYADYSSEKIAEGSLRQAAHAISQMNGLEALRVQLNSKYAPSQPEDKILMLKHLHCIKRLLVFKVFISWDTKTTAAYLPQLRPYDLEGGDGEVFPRAEKESNA